MPCRSDPWPATSCGRLGAEDRGEQHRYVPCRSPYTIGKTCIQRSPQVTLLSNQSRYFTSSRWFRRRRCRRRPVRLIRVMTEALFSRLRVGWMSNGRAERRARADPRRREELAGTKWAGKSPAARSLALAGGCASPRVRRLSIRGASSSDIVWICFCCHCESTTLTPSLAQPCPLHSADRYFDRPPWPPRQAPGHRQLQAHRSWCDRPLWLLLRHRLVFVPSQQVCHALQHVHRRAQRRLPTSLQSKLIQRTPPHSPTRMQ